LFPNNGIIFRRQACSPTCPQFPLPLPIEFTKNLATKKKKISLFLEMGVINF
jgi:hypothetical protein